MTMAADNLLLSLSVHAQLVRNAVGEESFRFWLLQECRGERLTLKPPKRPAGRPHLVSLPPPDDDGPSPAAA